MEVGSPSRVMMELGGHVVSGLREGIRDKWDGFVGWWNGKVDALPDFFSDRMEVGSPSRVMMELGGHVVDGLEQALKRMDQVMPFTEPRTPEVQGAQASAGGGRSVTIEEVHVRDVRSLEDLIRQLIDEADRKEQRRFRGNTSPM